MTSPVVRRYALAALLLPLGLAASVALEHDNMPVLSGIVRAEADQVTFGGIVRPLSETTVPVELGVRIEDVLVNIGDVVEAGQPLFAIDDRDAGQSLPVAQLAAQEAELRVRTLEHQLAASDQTASSLSARYALVNAEAVVAEREAQNTPTHQVRDSPERAQALYDLATVKVERIRRLHEQGLIARQEVDDAEAEARIAKDDLNLAKQAESRRADLTSAEATRLRVQAQLSEAERQGARLERQSELELARIQHERAVMNVELIQQRVENTRITSPASGTVSEIPVSRGDQVPSGGVVARLADLSRLAVELQVPSERIVALRRGALAAVRINTATPIARSGTIRSIEPVPGPNGTHTVIVEFPNDERLLLVGQAASITLTQ